MNEVLRGRLECTASSALRWRRRSSRALQRCQSGRASAAISDELNFALARRPSTRECARRHRQPDRVWRAHLSRLSRCARACRDGCGLRAGHIYALRRPSPQAVASVAGMLSRTSEALLELQHKAPAPPPCRARAAASAVASAATSAAASAATSAIASARGRRRQRRCQCRRRRLQRHPSAVQPLGSLSSSPSGAGSGAGSGRRRHARVRCAPLPPSSASSLAAGSPAPCALLPTPPPPASCLLPPASSDRQRARAIWQARPPAPTRRPRAGARAIARTSHCGSSPCSDVGARARHSCGRRDRAGANPTHPAHRAALPLPLDHRAFSTTYFELATPDI